MITKAGEYARQETNLELNKAIPNIKNIKRLVAKLKFLNKRRSTMVVTGNHSQ